MDRHDLPGVTLSDAAKAHKKDLEHQAEYNCKAMTYWVDEERESAFCLIEAPNKKAVKNLHNRAHGLIPHDIIEVNSNLVKSFLGRIHDSELGEDTALEVAADSALRALMVIETSNYIDRIEDNQFDLFFQKFHNSTNKTIGKYNGKVVLLKSSSYLVSFKTVTNAVSCALKIRSKLKYITPNFDDTYRNLKIGISVGEPVTNKAGLFEDAINLATNLCEVVEGEIVVSSEAKALYEAQNHNAFLDRKVIRVLKPREEKFLTHLMHYVDRHWNDPEFNVSNFSTQMGYSKSQLNRKLKALTGSSPNNFIRELRLKRALKMLYNQKGNISEVAFATGFNSPAYFSKCFQDYFGVLPSSYMQQHVS